jgi:hypothetical protein
MQAPGITNRKIGTIFEKQTYNFEIMKNLLLIIALFGLKTVGSQETATVIPASQTNTTVIVHKDPRVDALIKKQGSINKTVKKNTARFGKGYRLMVVNTNKRDEVIAAKTKIYTHFPELKAYIAYQSPYFKLKAGNFKTRDEAERYRKLVSSLFPKGVFIMNDTIEIKPEKDKEEIEE